MTHSNHPTRILIAATALALVPLQAFTAKVVVVDVVDVTSGYRASELRGRPVQNDRNQKIGDLDDLVIGRDRVLFAILEVGGFLGIGRKFVAVPYQSLQLNAEGTQIVLPGATEQELKALPEFKYPA